MKSVLEQRLHDGFKDSPHARVHVKWASAASPGVGIDYRIRLVTGTAAEQYEQWASSEAKALFGSNPDAKVLAMAGTLGDPAERRILDVGAVTGRNALPLARAGNATDALELSEPQIAWSTAFTRSDLDEVARDLPLSLLSDEPVYAYEKEHQPATGWPPTGWFEDWSRGFNGYGVESGLPPLELRWLVYRKRPS